MTNRIIVVADDLTGAAECAIGLRNSGFTVSMRLLGESDTARLAAPSDGGCDAMVLATELRTMRNDVASVYIESILSDAFSQADTRPLVVAIKIDSLLRGPIAGIVAGARASRPDTRITVIAALPEHGRTTVAGVQYVHGVPLAETDEWHLESATAPETVAEAVGADRADDVEIVDAAAPGDIDRAVGDDPTTTVWVGTSAMVRAIGSACAPARTAATSGYQPDSGPMFAVIGSASPTAATQVQALVDAGAHPIELEAGALARADADDIARLGDRLCAVTAAGDVVVTLTGPADVDNAEEVSRALAAVVAPAARAAQLLVLTGGHTARRVLTAIDVEALEPVDEPKPGVVLSRAVSRGGTHHQSPQFVITKAGAFGDPQTLAHAAQIVRTEGNTQ